MTRRLVAAVAVAIALAGSACSSGGSKDPASTGTTRPLAPTTTAETIPVATLQASASAITDQLIAHKWADVVAKFNSAMKATFTADGLKTAWGQVEATYGPYKSRSTTAQSHPADTSAVTFDTPLQFTKSGAKSRISFDANGDVSNLFILASNVP